MGLLVVLFPLITFVYVGTGGNNQPATAISRGLTELNGSSSQTSKSDTSTLESLAVSLAIAVAGFIFLRRRRPQSERHYTFGQLPY
ncbi:MAG TPA: hypothetical protein VEH86_08490 [Candidatus Acidoferrum sp.]|nr:hypothetical protein [Candidatus Acidoferrum sp.]